MRKTILRLLALFLLIISVFLTEAWKKTVPAPDAQVKRRASERTLACCEAIKAYKAQLGLPADPVSDPCDTGMLGPEYSDITTTLGNLEAKRTALNPNMAAVVVDMFQELGLKPGDLIAVNFSGSFPSLNIAVLCAAEEMGLETFLMSSYGASTHGANDPELTYPDMEAYLNEKGLLHTKSMLVSTGGMEDVGKEMPDSVKKRINDRLAEKGYTLYDKEGLLENIRDRYERYRSAGDVRCFVNVGGNDVSFGDSMIIVHADGGILTNLPEEDHSTGLVQLFLQDGIPVVHLLNIKSIASRYGLPIDPVPLPKCGEGEVYQQVSYPRGVAGTGALLALALLVFTRERKKTVRVS